MTACDLWSPTEPTPINAELTLAPGEIRSVSDLSLKFEEVVGDNRCPGDATCILGGSATVRIMVQGPANAVQRYDLTTGEMRPVQHRGVRIELLEVTPYPFASMPFDPSDYRVKLRVVR